MSEGIPISREAVRVLALEVGAREAARSLGLNENTVLSWSHSEKWKLPKRNGVGVQASREVTQSRAQSAVGDLLIAHHAELEERGKAALAKAGVASAEAVQGPLRVNSTRDLNDLANAMAKVFGWSQSGNTVNVHADKAVVICDEGRRNELIEQRARLLGDKVNMASTEKAVLGKTTDT